LKVTANSAPSNPAQAQATWLRVRANPRESDGEGTRSMGPGGGQERNAKSKIEIKASSRLHKLSGRV
jgi:hypothetical protein